MKIFAKIARTMHELDWPIEHRLLLACLAQRHGTGDWGGIARLMRQSCRDDMRAGELFTAKVRLRELFGNVPYRRL